MRILYSQSGPISLSQRVRLVYEFMVERSFYLVKTVFDKIIKKATLPF